MTKQELSDILEKESNERMRLFSLECLAEFFYTHKLDEKALDVHLYRVINDIETDIEKHGCTKFEQIIVLAIHRHSKIPSWVKEY